MEIIYPDWIAIQYSVLSSSADVWHWVSCSCTLSILKPSSEYQSLNFPDLWISEHSGIKMIFTLSRSPRPLSYHQEGYSKKACTGFSLKFSLLTQSGLCLRGLPFKRDFGSWGAALCAAPLPRLCLPQPRLHSSCLLRCTAPRHSRDTAHPGEKIAWDYIMKDRLVVCMHKRAKLRSCSQFCNDFWLLYFSSASTLLPIERPYFPPILHYSFSSAFSLLLIPGHLQNPVSVSCPYFDTFCIYDSHTLLLFLTVVWTNSSLPKAAVSWQIQLPPPRLVLMSDSSFSQTLTQNTFRCTEDFWI